MPTSSTVAKATWRATVPNAGLKTSVNAPGPAGDMLPVNDLLLRNSFNIMNGIPYQEQVIMDTLVSKAPDVGRAFAILDLLTASEQPLGIPDRAGIGTSQKHRACPDSYVIGRARNTTGRVRLPCGFSRFAVGARVQPA